LRAARRSAAVHRTSCRMRNPRRCDHRTACKTRAMAVRILRAGRGWECAKQPQAEAHILCNILLLLRQAHHIGCSTRPLPLVWPRVRDGRVCSHSPCRSSNRRRLTCHIECKKPCSLFVNRLDACPRYAHPLISDAATAGVPCAALTVDSRKSERKYLRALCRPTGLGHTGFPPMHRTTQPSKGGSLREPVLARGAAHKNSKRVVSTALRGQRKIPKALAGKESLRVGDLAIHKGDF